MSDLEEKERRRERKLLVKGLISKTSDQEESFARRSSPKFRNDSLSTCRSPPPAKSSDLKLPRVKLQSEQ
jgi:hypothetical protein